MPDVVFSHNRWHPDIPPAVTVRPGQQIRVECREWTEAYLLLGAAPIEGRVSGVVDIPNACCSLYLPTAIFDFDIRPSASGPVRADRGTCAVSS